MSKSFIDQVSRINTSLYEVRSQLDILIKEWEEGRIVLEECQIDPGSYRDVIRLSVRKTEQYHLSVGEGREA